MLLFPLVYRRCRISSAHSRVRARGARRTAVLQDCRKIQHCDSAECLALSVLYNPLALENGVIFPRPEVRLVDLFWLLCSGINLSHLKKNWLWVIANWKKSSEEHNNSSLKVPKGLVSWSVGGCGLVTLFKETAASDPLSCCSLGLDSWSSTPQGRVRRTQRPTLLQLVIQKRLSYSNQSLLKEFYLV